MAEAKSIEAETGEDFSQSIEMDYEAIKLYGSTSNKKRLPETYYFLGLGFGLKAGLMKHLKI